MAMQVQNHYLIFRVMVKISETVGQAGRIMSTVQLVPQEYLLMGEEIIHTTVLLVGPNPLTQSLEQ